MSGDETSRLGILRSGRCRRVYDRCCDCRRPGRRDRRLRHDSCCGMGVSRL